LALAPRYGTLIPRWTGKPWCHQAELQGRDYTFILRTTPVFLFQSSLTTQCLKVAYLLLQHWDEYNLSPKFLAAYFEAYDGTMNEEDDCGDPDWNREDHNAKIVLECFSHLEFSVIFNLRSDDSLVQMVASSFKGAGHGHGQNGCKL
jgi:hypothetical protein